MISFAQPARAKHARKSNILKPLLQFSGALICLSLPPAAHANEPPKPDTAVCSIKVNPQAPRDISDIVPGKNSNPVNLAPSPDTMSLCNIHFHRSAEHRSTGFKEASKDGDNTGFVCSIKDATQPAKPAKDEHGHVSCQSLPAGDTIEVHWVFTSCPPPEKPYVAGLANCTRCKTDKVAPVLRVEAKVFSLSSNQGEDFADYNLAPKGAQPKKLPDGANAVTYLGSTTGPAYDANKACSPLTATWNVRPTCSPLKIGTLKAWCNDNAYGEKLAHGVRPLVSEPDLLAPIKK